MLTLFVFYATIKTNKVRKIKMKQEDLIDFGDYIKNMRIKHGISQETLAKHSNVSTSAIAKYERGLGNPKEGTREKILRGLKALTVDDPVDPEIEDVLSDDWLYYKDDIDELARRLNPAGLEKVRNIMYDLIDIYKYKK